MVAKENLAIHVPNTASGHEGLSDRLDPETHVGIEACDMASPVVEHSSVKGSSCRSGTQRSSAR
jgi:hypothetical protein